jgi:hypothetical protein
VTEAHQTGRDAEQLMAAVLVIPLVWTVGVGTRPVAMTGGTTSEVNPAESLAPPARIGLATFGLGKIRGMVSTAERRAIQGGIRRLIPLPPTLNRNPTVCGTKAVLVATPSPTPRMAA